MSIVHYVVNMINNILFMVNSSKKSTSKMSKQEVQLVKDLATDAKQFLEKHKHLITYDVQEFVIKNLVAQYPNHKSFEAVATKAKLLNLFYSTGIQAIDAMAHNIFRIENIDEILSQPTYSAKLIKAIAKLDLKDSTRNNYSFATKYCALHEPTKYPIYDSIVAAVLSKLMVTGQLPPFVYERGKHKKTDDWHMSQGEFEARLKDYDFFVKVYDIFMEDYGLKEKFTYREVDWYIWGSFKEAGKLTEIEKLAPISSEKYIEYTAPKITKKYRL